MAKKFTEGVNESLGDTEPVPVTELGNNNGDIELSTDRVIDKNEAELELFMNDVLDVEVLEDASPNAVEFPCVSINGISQYFIRGKVHKVKRKYVEGLARARVKHYVQRTPNPTQPDNIQMVPRSSLAYQFVVHKDPNPKGTAWLQNILRQPA